MYIVCIVYGFHMLSWQWTKIIVFDIVSLCCYSYGIQNYLIYLKIFELSVWNISEPSYNNNLVVTKLRRFDKHFFNVTEIHCYNSFLITLSKDIYKLTIKTVVNFIDNCNVIFKQIVSAKLSGLSSKKLENMVLYKFPTFRFFFTLLNSSGVLVMDQEVKKSKFCD